MTEFSIDDPVKSKKSLPLAYCRFCGSTWFRVADINRYPPQTQAHLQAPTSWVELLNQTRPQLRICLCGAPLRPEIAGGLAGGLTAHEEFVSFKKSLDRALADLESSRRDLEKALKHWVENPLTKDDLHAVAARLREAEEMVLWEQRKAVPKEVFGARKPWKKIGREAETKTALGRDDLVLALQEKGFTYRMARRLVKVILKECLLQLRLDQSLETPIGKFLLDKAPKEREHWAFGYPVKTYRKKWWVHFLAAADLTIRADAGDARSRAEKEDPEEEEDEEMAKPVACPRCGSTWMMEAEFRQYMEAYGSTPGADIFALDGPAFRLRVCLCGQPIGPTLRKYVYHLDGLDDFRKNIEKARQYLQQAGAVDEALKYLLLNLARWDEQELLLARLSNVVAGLKTLGWEPTDAV
jgi:hypothetical protein